MFGHFSSGTFAHADTYYGSKCIVNPLLLFREATNFRSKTNFDLPDLNIDRDAIVTTPYDMLINQMQSFSSKMTCGAGINETVQRSTFRAQHHQGYDIFGDIFNIKFGEIQSAENLRYRLELIKRYWVPYRLHSLGLDKRMNEDLYRRLFDKKISETFIEQMMILVDNTRDVSVVEKLKTKTDDHIIFEGAQGLGLDEVNGHYPYVTRSRTGLNNALDICKRIDVNEIDIYYVTRAYLTRHGDGPMESELKTPPYKGIVENTNVYNQYQGGFRYGHIDAKELQRRIQTDLRANMFMLDGIKVKVHLAVTCLDQINDDAFFKSGKKSKKIKTTRKTFAADLAHFIGFNNYLESYGPTRDTIYTRMMVS